MLSLLFGLWVNSVVLLVLLVVGFDLLFGGVVVG